MPGLKLFLGLFFVLVASAAGAEERFKIGVPIPLTGEVATWGADIKNTLLFANQKLGSGRYELIFEDDQCNSRAAVTAAQKLIKVDKVKAAIGFACSNSLLAPAKEYEDGRVVAITTSAGSSKISGLSPSIFRVFPSNTSGAQVLFQYLQNRFRHVGLLAEQTDWLTDYSDIFAALANRSLVKLTVDSYPPDTNDFRPLLLRLKARGIEALVLNTQSERALLDVLRQLDQLGWAVPRFGNITPGSSAFLQKAGSLSEGIIFNDVPSLDESLTASARMLHAEFVRRYGNEQGAPLLFATTYAAFEMLNQAVLSGRPVQEALRAGSFNTVMGQLSFNAGGDAMPLEQVLKVVRDGKAVAMGR